MSHACHIGCWCVGGRRGQDTGVAFAADMMRSASRKLRNSDATSRSWGVQAQEAGIQRQA